MPRAAFVETGPRAARPCEVRPHAPRSASGESTFRRWIPALAAVTVVQTTIMAVRGHSPLRAGAIGLATAGAGIVLLAIHRWLRLRNARVAVTGTRLSATSPFGRTHSVEVADITWLHLVAVRWGGRQTVRYLMGIGADSHAVWRVRCVDLSESAMRDALRRVDRPVSGDWDQRRAQSDVRADHPGSFPWWHVSPVAAVTLAAVVCLAATQVGLAALRAG